MDFRMFWKVNEEPVAVGTGAGAGRRLFAEDVGPRKRLDSAVGPTADVARPSNVTIGVDATLSQGWFAIGVPTVPGQMVGASALFFRLCPSCPSGMLQIHVCWAPAPSLHVVCGWVALATPAVSNLRVCCSSRLGAVLCLTRRSGSLGTQHLGTRTVLKKCNTRAANSARTANSRILLKSQDAAVARALRSCGELAVQH